MQVLNGWKWEALRERLRRWRRVVWGDRPKRSGYMKAAKD